MSNTYTPNFYDIIRPGCQSSAAVVAPLVLNLIATEHPRVIDVGCGEGWWAQAFADLGAEVIGLDGAYVQSSPLGDRFIPHDLNKPLPAHLAGRFDLAICLEVAEHLPAKRADSFIGDLCGLAPVILFSAAIKGQGGVGHLNEQPPKYWASLFEKFGFSVTGALRWQVWDDDRVENWYRQNILIASKLPADSENLAALFASPMAEPWLVVHPILFDARRKP